MLLLCDGNITKTITKNWDEEKLRKIRNDINRRFIVIFIYWKIENEQKKRDNSL